MKKLLYVGDSPTVETGFGRVTEQMLDKLKDHFEVHLIDVNYYKDKHDFPYPIYPAGGKDLEYLKSSPYGAEYLAEVFNEVKPDVVVSNNDTWVVAKYVEILEPYIASGAVKFFGYVPVDGGPYHHSLVYNISSWTGMATYTEFGREVLLNTGMRSDVEVIPHGTNIHDFYEMDHKFARKRLNLDPDTWYVFNGNRNQPRKRYDILTKGYAEFLSMIPSDAKVSFFAHGGITNNGGWNVAALLEREMIDRGLDPKRPILSQYTNKPYPQNMVSKKMLNIIYNAMDVGINTCQGEGWGLVNTEHAVTGVPQIVPDHSSLGELFADGRGLIMPTSWWETERPYLIERGIIDPHDVAKALHYAYTHRKEMTKIGQKAQKYFLSKELSWDHASDLMLKWITDRV